MWGDLVRSSSRPQYQARLQVYVAVIEYSDVWAASSVDGCLATTTQLVGGAVLAAMRWRRQGKQWHIRATINKCDEVTRSQFNGKVSAVL